MPSSNLAVSFCGGDYPSRTAAELGLPNDKLYTALDKSAAAATKALVESYGCNEEQCKGMICAAVFPVCDLASIYSFPVCRFTCKECAATCRDKALPNVTLSGGISTRFIVGDDLTCNALPDQKSFACTSGAPSAWRASAAAFTTAAVMLMLVLAS